MICYFPINNDYSKKERDGQDDKKYHDKSLYIIQFEYNFL